jgi:hypothetical protein
MAIAFPLYLLLYRSTVPHRWDLIRGGESAAILVLLLLLFSALVNALAHRVNGTQPQASK